MIKFGQSLKPKALKDNDIITANLLPSKRNHFLSNLAKLADEDDWDINSLQNFHHVDDHQRVLKEISGVYSFDVEEYDNRPDELNDGLRLSFTMKAASLPPDRVLNLSSNFQYFYLSKNHSWSKSVWWGEKLDSETDSSHTLLALDDADYNKIWVSVSPLSG